MDFCPLVSDHTNNLDIQYSITYLDVYYRKPPRPHRRRPMVTDFFETFSMRRGPQKNIRFLL